MSDLILKKLKKYAEQNYNVLLEGEAGVGKTSLIKAAFEGQGLHWKYFSAATMDPWVDFIGVPKEHVNEDGSKFLDLVRPKEFAKDEVEAIFFDELNRAPAKVRNAVMELIQFKSINGKKFNNLRMIWAAINPYTEDEEYNVEKLDPAQEDRFHVKIAVPYDVDTDWFKQAHSTNGVIAASWWKKLDQKAKKLISPRRLDYALSGFSSIGPEAVRDILPNSVGVQTLLAELKMGGSYEALIDEAIKLGLTGDTAKLDKLITDPTSFKHLNKKIVAGFKTQNKLKERVYVFSSIDNLVLNRTHKVAADKVLLFFNNSLDVLIKTIYELKDDNLWFDENTDYQSFVLSLQNKNLQKDSRELLKKIRARLTSDDNKSPQFLDKKMVDDIANLDIAGTYTKIDTILSFFDILRKGDVDQTQLPHNIEREIVSAFFTLQIKTIKTKNVLSGIDKVNANYIFDLPQTTSTQDVEKWFKAHRNIPNTPMNVQKLHLLITTFI